MARRHGVSAGSTRARIAQQQVSTGIVHVRSVRVDAQKLQPALIRRARQLRQQGGIGRGKRKRERKREQEEGKGK